MKRWGEKRYYSLDYYIKETFGEKLYKLALDLMPFWEYVFIIASGLLVYRALARKVEDLEIRGDL